MKLKTTQPTADKLMTIAQYAAQEGVSVTAVYNWIGDKENKKNIKTTKIGKITMIITA